MARANSPTAMVPAPGRAVLEKPTTRAPRITRSQGPMPRAGTSAASSGMVSEPISGVHPLAGRSADGVRLRPTPSSWRTPWTPSSTKSSHEEHEGREAKSKAARALLADSEHPDVDGEPTAGQGAGPMALTENTARHEASKTVRLRSRDNQVVRSEEHTSELQSRGHLVCRLLLEKKKAVRGAVHDADPQERTTHGCARRP